MPHERLIFLPLLCLGIRHHQIKLMDEINLRPLSRNNGRAPQVSIAPSALPVNPSPLPTLDNNSPSATQSPLRASSLSADDGAEQFHGERAYVPGYSEPRRVYPTVVDHWSDILVRPSVRDLNFMLGKPKKDFRVPSRVELRHRVLTTTPTLRLKPDTILLDTLNERKQRLSSATPHASSIEVQLNEDLAKISIDDKYRRLQAHRLAMEKYMTLQDESSRSLLRRVFTAYEEIGLHKFSQHIDEITTKLRLSEEVSREAINERNALRQHCEAMRLEILNLERCVQARDELLSEIATTHKINISTVDWIHGGTNNNNNTTNAMLMSSSSPGRTMADIRAVQDRVATRHSENAKNNREEAADVLQSKEEAERVKALMADTEAMLSKGVDALHGVFKASQRVVPADDDAQTRGGEAMSDVYIAAQRNHVGLDLVADEEEEEEEGDENADGRSNDTAEN